MLNHPRYVVCVKPHGVESEKQMPRLLSEQLGQCPIYTVHRLDKETKGVMVFAKEKSAAAYFSKELQENRVEKRYFAVVKGCPQEEKGTFTDLLFRDKQKNKSYVVKGMRKGVKEAVLTYQVLTPFSHCQTPHTVVEIALQTGRTHQIRVQFASRKMPLLGDKKYGGDPHTHLCLTAYSLAFTDPDGKAQRFCLEEEPNKILLS